MSAREAFYSIIQFCADFERAEAVNVGVALFVVPEGTVEVRMVESSDVVRRRFPDVSDDRRLASERRAFENRLRSACPRTRDEIHKFMALELGRLVLVPPRPHRVEADLAAAADRLFAELVEPSPVSRRERVRAPDLRRDLEPLLIGVPIERDLTVAIPVLERTFSAPIAYRNGVMNYLRPFGFSTSAETALRSAERCGIEGHLLFKHPLADGTPQRLVVVASFGDQESRSKIEGMLSECDVTCVGGGRMAELAAEIRRQAH